MKLARELVTLYHGEQSVAGAEEYFIGTYQKNIVTEQTPVLQCLPEFISEDGTINLVELIFSSNKYKSKGEVRRLISSGAVKVNNEKVYDITYAGKEAEFVLQIGKGTIFSVIIK